MSRLRKVLEKIFHDRYLTVALDSDYVKVLNMLGLRSIIRV